MNKYQAIGRYLSASNLERVQLTYDEINAMCPLPSVAYRDRPFWANTWRNNHARAWLQAGYVVDKVSLGHFVIFQHDTLRAKDPGKGRSNGIDGCKWRQDTKGRHSQLAISRPCPTEVERYLCAWDELEAYPAQELALDDLFFKHCPKNKSLSDILLKVAALNTFYSTNIFAVASVAEHILKLDIDVRLREGDLTLVNDLQTMEVNGRKKHFYSFATKYCSHHNPIAFPIYDSYVEKTLCYFRDVDGFTSFKRGELKDYINLCRILKKFQQFYGLEEYRPKEIDKYLWQVGKEFFPNKYNKKKD